MKIEISNDKSYSEIELTIRTSFQIANENKIILCTDMFHALAEVTRGLFSLYPHRMGLIYQNDGAPHNETMMPFFSREGFTHQNYTYKQMVEHQEELLGKLGKAGLFVALTDDDPFTGELFEHSDLESKLNTSKVFCIRTSYSHFLYEPSPIAVSPFGIRIFSISKGLTAVILGERVNIDQLHFGPSYFENHLVERLSNIIKKRQGEQGIVKGFELKAQRFAKAVFSDSSTRLYDRSALFFEDIEGSALLEEFKNEIHLSSEVCLNKSEPLIETASLCKWDGTTDMGWLKRHGYSLEQIRGLVILDISLLNDNTLQALERAYQKVLKMQNG